MSNRIPSYRLHKPSGRAVVTLNGKDQYLGPFGSIESREKYGRLIAESASGIPATSAVPLNNRSLTVNELALAFLLHAKKHYSRDGKPTDEYDCLRSAIRPLVELYGDFEAKNFGPLALKAVRQQMICKKWTRDYINKSVSRIRRMFRFGVSNELIDAEILRRLEALEPLLEGRTDALESIPRYAVPDASIEAVRAIVKERIRDLIDLALLTGARPGELVRLTGGIIDRSEEIWTTTFAQHKTSHRGKRRVLAFGPKAQVILKKYLKANPAVRLFPMTRSTFSNNLKAACDKLGLTRWTGHWLRHNAATEMRYVEGLDAAQVMLGHSKADTTEIYAHLDNERICELARKHG